MIAVGGHTKLLEVLKVLFVLSLSRRGRRFTMNSLKPAVLLSVALAAAVEACALKPGQTTTTGSAVPTTTPTQPNVDWFRTSPNAYAGRYLHITVSIIDYIFYITDDADPVSC